MKPVKKSVIAITITGVLTGTALAALADTTKGKPFEGAAVQNIVVLEQYPTEVQGGSIPVKDETEEAMGTKAKLSSAQAAAIARKALPGKVVEAKLGEENGYLIWEIEVVGAKGQQAQLKIDAGNGRLLAAETGEDEQRKGVEGREDRDGDHEGRNEGSHTSGKDWHGSHRGSHHVEPA
jgi:uncharacterized membrane protein YkoI